MGWKHYEMVARESIAFVRAGRRGGQHVLNLALLVPSIYMLQLLDRVLSSCSTTLAPSDSLV